MKERNNVLHRRICHRRADGEQAILTMGLLGGAMATQIRAQNPLFSHVLFSLYVGLFMWGGLWLRNGRLRALFPLVRGANRPEQDR